MSLTRSLARYIALLKANNQDSSYEKACGERRGSAPATPVLGGRPTMESTPSRLVNFFSKRSFKSNPLKRTKSVTKLERKRITIDGDSLHPIRLRASRSHESLLTSQSMMHTIDLANGEVQVKSLHSSILGQEHCFQVSSNTGTKFFSCRTAEERDRWIESLRRTIHPNQEQIRRTDNSLKIWILEAKGIATKKRYFCELCLDKTLYARTSSKQKANMCFWGEHFDFNNLPTVQTININLYREAEKKKKKEKNFLVGVVNIPIAAITSRHLIEKWYTVVPEKGTNTKDPPAIRIKCRFQMVDILPLELYREFLMYLKTSYLTLCDMLEPVITVKAKEDIATTLVHVMQKENGARDFLADIVMADIHRIDDEHLTFRGNSLATKAMEAYMKLIGEKYLQDTLGEFIRTVIESSDDCEVDPLKVSSIGNLQKQQANLLMYVEMAWVKIINSYCYFPMELREVFHLHRQRLANIGKEELCEHVISASIFLRFLCPAILSPSLFNLTQEYPNDKAARNLTLIAKTIQTLANFTRFVGKENFMEYMNEFVEREWGPMKTFLRQISSPLSPDHQTLEFDGYIDLGKELSLLHTLLGECMPKVKSKSFSSEVTHLQKILEGINGSLKQPPSTQVPNNPALSHPSYPPTNTPLHPNFYNKPNQGTNLSNSNNYGGAHTPEVGELRTGGSTHYQSLQRNLLRTLTTGAEPCLPQPQVNVIPGHLERSASPQPKASTLPRNAYLPVQRTASVEHAVQTEDPPTVYPPSNYAHQRNVSAAYGQSVANANIERASRTTVEGNGVVGAGFTSGTNHPANVTSYAVPNHRYHHVGSGSPNENRHHAYLDLLQYMDDVVDELDANLNLQGSQMSISQLSTVASSGYQSFAYSQSSSPVDPVIGSQEGHINAHPHNHAPHHQRQLSSSSIVPRLLHNNHHYHHHHHPPPPPPAPLAFTNPMYHFPTGNEALAPSHRGVKMEIVNAPHVGSTPQRSLSRSSSGASSSSASTSSGASAGSSDSCTCDVGMNVLHSQLPNRVGIGMGNRRKLHSVQSPRISNHHHHVVNNRHPVNMSSASSSVDQDSPSPPSPEPPSRISAHNSINNNNSMTDSRISDEYEGELDELRTAMISLQSKLTEAEEKLQKQECSTEQAMADWRARLEADEERMRRQQEEKDEQLRNIISRLISVEEELRREQSSMHKMIAQKQQLIETQERKITSLDTANSRLLSALQQIKERYQNNQSRTNGMRSSMASSNSSSSSSPLTSPAKPPLSTENGEYKSSSC